MEKSLLFPFINTEELCVFIFVKLKILRIFYAILPSMFAREKEYNPQTIWAKFIPQMSDIVLKIRT